jgi:hypothetical protein
VGGILLASVTELSFNMFGFHKVHPGGVPAARVQIRQVVMILRFFFLDCARTLCCQSFIRLTPTDGVVQTQNWTSRVKIWTALIHWDSNLALADKKAAAFPSPAPAAAERREKRKRGKKDHARWDSNPQSFD